MPDSSPEIRPTGTPFVSLENVGYVCGDEVIVDQISLQVERQGILILIGPNGAGKTTILKLILGLVSPTSGKILRSEGITFGYVPQKIFFPKSLPMTVDRFLRLNRQKIINRDADVLNKTGVENLMQKEVQNLSGGEMQRVLLAKALLSDPAMLVLDEPTQGLDPGAEERFYELLYALSDRHAIVMVSHDLHVVMAKSDHVICVNKHICCQGKPSEVLLDSNYLSLYGHHHDHIHLPDGRIRSIKFGGIKC